MFYSITTEILIPSCLDISKLVYSNTTLQSLCSAIKVLPVGTSRSVKKLLKKQNVPDLSKYEDISDFITKSVCER